MDHKLIALDLDGTLLDSRKKISQRNIAAIQKAEELGCKVVLITGRGNSTVKPYLDILPGRELTGYFQGALVVDEFNGLEMYRTALKKIVCESIYLDAIKRRLSIQAYKNGDAYVENYNENAMFYEKTTGARVKYVDSLEPMILSDDNFKLLINAEPGTIARNFDFFRNKYSHDANVVLSCERFIEFTHKDADKGNALKYIASRYGVDRKNVIAMGDQMNDLPMLTWAGVGVAMGNATDDVKSRADMVTLSNDEDGVACAIARLLEIEV